MSVYPFCGGVHDDVGSPVERVAQIASRSESVVCHERHAGRVRHTGDGFQVGHGACGVAHAFREHRTRAAVDERFVGLRSVVAGDAYFYSQAAQRVAELIVRASVQKLRCHNVVAFRGQRCHCYKNRCHARRHSQCAHAAVECGHTLFVGRSGGVLQSGVYIAGFRQIEKTCGVVAVLESVCGCGVYGHAARACVFVSVKSCVDLTCLEF